MNLVTLIGRLGQDPDVRVMQNSEKVAALSIATTEKWTDKQTGVKKESTEWHRVVLYRRLAEIAELYVKKGHLVSIIGKIKTRKWTDSGSHFNDGTIAQYDIVGMWEEPRPTVTLTLPCPLKEPRNIKHQELLLFWRKKMN
ncbi:single-stranded DNA-binding protein, partial [Mannheimia haemolytica]|uniref:single-stranded DNA-binding protein n=1 Tax=Mannheimia haemolytica TaxID=75985 RepID=UPI0002E64B76